MSKDNLEKCPHCGKLIQPICNGFMTDEETFYEVICPLCDEIIDED